MVQQPPLPTHATSLLFVGASRRPSFVVERCKLPFKELGPSEVLVRVRLAGLCASDLWRFVSEGDEGPLILGHEAVGDVVASRRPGVDVGARVVFSASNWCMACEWCLQGAYVACENVNKYGHRPLAALSGGALGGALSSHVLLRGGTAVVALPDAVPDAHALLATCPLATALAGVLRVTTAHRRLPPPRGPLGAEGGISGERRPTALVQGCDLVGILACAVLTQSGFRVLCEDADPRRLRLAAKFHAQPLFRDAGPLTPVPALPDRLDAVVIAIGSGVGPVRGMGYGDRKGQQQQQGPPPPPLLRGHAHRLLRPGGTLLLLGQPSPGTGTDTAILEVGAILSMGLCVIGTSEYEPGNLEDAVKFLEATRGTFPYDELLSPVYGMLDFQSALACALDRKFPCVLVRPC